MMPHTETSPSSIDSSQQDVQRRLDILKFTASISAIVLITVASFWIALNPQWLERFGNWGYLGAFIVSLIASATVVLPAPGIAIVVAMGTALNPLLLSLAAGIGSGFGELSGYLAGAGGRALVSERHQPWLERIHRWAEQSHAPLLFFILAAVPFPLFDLAGIAAGMMRLRISTFVVAVSLGKTLKYLVLILLVDYFV